MATRIHKSSVDAACWVKILSERSTRLNRVPDPPAPVPLTLEGRGGLAISARCSDFGEVDLEIWAGDPGQAPAGWIVAFDGSIEVGPNGLTVGSAFYPVFHVDLPSGRSHVRVDAHRDSDVYVDSLRLVFSDAPNLKGSAVSEWPA
jgi:hypothetical protein